MKVLQKTESESIQIEVDFRPWLELQWYPGTYQDIDDVRRPSEPNGHEYKCTLAGYTGAEEPDEFKDQKPSVGQIFVDGGVRWVTQRASTEGQDAIASISISTDAGLTVGSSSYSGNLVLATVSGGTEGNQYEVSFEITTAAGWVYEKKETINIYGP